MLLYAQYVFLKKCSHQNTALLDVSGHPSRSLALSALRWFLYSSVVAQV